MAKNRIGKRTPTTSPKAPKTEIVRLRVSPKMADAWRSWRDRSALDG